MESVSDDEVEFYFEQNEKKDNSIASIINVAPIFEENLNQAYKDRRANIRHDKKIYAVGYRLYKSGFRTIHFRIL